MCGDEALAAVPAALASGVLEAQFKLRRLRIEHGRVLVRSFGAAQNSVASSKDLLIDASDGFATIHGYVSRRMGAALVALGRLRNDELP